MGFLPPCGVLKGMGIRTGGQWMRTAGRRPDYDPSMARTRQIVHYPDPVLRRRAKPVERVDEAIRSLVREMFEIMEEEEGIGLAAPQVGESLRIFVTGTHAESGHPPRAYINPVLSGFDGELESHDEGCLSLPGIRGEIRRQPHAMIEALDLEGKPFRLESGEFIARVWQHEFDHLEGVMIIDRMTALDRLRVRRALKELESGG
jgi:peptide deformylase